MPTTIVNLRTHTCDVSIARPSKWGNPHPIGWCPHCIREHTREEVIEIYERYICSRLDLIVQLRELKGKVLGCYCKPLACHGDVLVKLIEELL